MSLFERKRVRQAAAKCEKRREPEGRRIGARFLWFVSLPRSKDKTAGGRFGRCKRPQGDGQGGPSSNEHGARGRDPASKQLRDSGNNASGNNTSTKLTNEALSERTNYNSHNPHWHLTHCLLNFSAVTSWVLMRLQSPHNVGKRFLVKRCNILIRSVFMLIGRKGKGFIMADGSPKYRYVKWSFCCEQ